QHDRAEADRGTIHQNEFARNRDRAERAQALLHLPYLAAAIGVRCDAVGDGPDAILEKWRIDEARPDIEGIDDVVGELLEAPAAISVDDPLAVAPQEPFIEVDHAFDEAWRKDADAAEVEEVDPGGRRIAFRARLRFLAEHRVVAEMGIAVDDAEAGEGIPP